MKGSLLPAIRRERGPFLLKAEQGSHTVSDTLFIRTEFGFWKIYQMDRGFVLYHCSKYDRTKTFEALMHDVFHRQCDVLAYESLFKLINYIVEHDRAKRIILEDYKKLPQRTSWKITKNFRSAPKSRKNITKRQSREPEGFRSGE